MEGVLMQPESHVLRAVMLRLSQWWGAKVFRNNVGIAKFFRGGREQTVVYGLCKGSSDAVGWTPITIEPCHVGKTIAVFTAAECKTDKGRLTDAQAKFLAAVERDGGIAIVARDEADVDTVMGAWTKGARNDNG